MIIDADPITDNGPVPESVPNACVGPSRPVDDSDALRLAAYRDTADPLFFKWQRGEATERIWLDEVAAIRSRYPKPGV